ncbi:MAG: heme-binding protein [Planctomycetota bacterium]|nr:MAG: heme-binding protein [Planctomycetota bacterium]
MNARCALLALIALLAVVGTVPVAAQGLDAELRQLPPGQLAQLAKQMGDPARGAVVFFQPYLACSKCHSVGEGRPSPLGPDLATLDKRVSDTELVVSVLEPSKTIRKGYEAVSVATESGKLLAGILVERTADKLVLRDLARQGEQVTLKTADITEVKLQAESLMPAGQMNQLASRQQFFDLIRYLMEVRDGGAARARALQPAAHLITLALPEYEKRIDHAGLVRDWNDGSFQRGEAIYQRVCANCHGTLDRAGSLPTSLRFAEGQFKNGSDPLALYQTLTRGFGQMTAQTWMVPSQKYDVIHYLRETYLKGKNPSQYTPVDGAYLARLPKGDTRGPAASRIEPWSAMDYGTTLTHTYEVPGKGHNFAYKGIAIRLDPGAGGVTRGRHWMLFDEDTLRVAAAWSALDLPRGEGAAPDHFINWRGIQLNGEHGIHPRLVGRVDLANGTGPGWANPRDGQWQDNARIIGRDDKRYGPLPADWARFRGLYQHGQQVVLDYTVGGAPVLESPRLLPGSSAAEPPVFGRVFQVGPRQHDLVLQVAEHPSDKAVLLPLPGGAVRLAAAALEEKPPAGPVRFDGASHLEVKDGDRFDLAGKPFSVVARFKTRVGGTLFAQTMPGSDWTPDSQALFVRGGNLVFDIGWVGAVSSRAKVDDGKWHTVAVVADPPSGTVRLFVDGKADGAGTLKSQGRLKGSVARIGLGARNFPGPRSYFQGELEEVRFYQKALESVPGDLAALAMNGQELAGRWVPTNLQGDLVRDLSTSKLDARVLRGPPATPDGPSAGPLLAGVFPADSPVTWVADGGKLRLKIPAGEQTLRFCLYTQTDGKATPVISLAPSDLDLVPLTRGGPSRWPQKLETMVVKGNDNGPFAVDLLSAPETNPWLAQTRFSGVDFFPDGRMALCSWDGDVWMVEPVGDKLRWQRIATGMFQPLGLKVVDGRIYVTCRDQLTVLHDLNGDGETDWYQCLNTDHQVTEHFHEFAMGLQTDKAGDFYYAKSARHGLKAVVPHHGTLLKVSKDGKKTEIIANGFRAANGVCLNPDGTFVVTDQEGYWNPKNRINWITPPDVASGGKPRFYGNMFGYQDVTDPSDDAMVPPLCWITNDFDRSPAELLWVESRKWGPLNGSLLNLSYGYGKVFVVPHEKTATGLMQGGMVELPIPAFPTGVMRGRFSQADGQLYLCGLFAWAGNATHPGGFYRLRATGQPMHLPTGLQATNSGLKITFTEPLEPKSVAADKVAVKVWGLKRTANYGSKHYDEHPLAVRGATLSPDGKTVTLELEGFGPTWGMEVVYTFQGIDGKTFTGKLHNTVHEKVAAGR